MMLLLSPLQTNRSHSSTLSYEQHLEIYIFKGCTHQAKPWLSGKWLHRKTGTLVVMVP